MGEPRRIAYLTGEYGRPSDTFIRHEVNQLRGRGLEVATYSIRRPEISGEVDPDVSDHRARTEYLLEAGLPRLLGGFIKQAVKRPLATSRVLRLAWRTRQPGLVGAAKQAVYVLEAARLAQRLLKTGVEHLHNHIGENSATVAMLASAWSGVPYSLTIHGPGIFYDPRRWALGEKIDRAAFTACISDYCRSQCLVFASPAAWRRVHVVRCAAPEPFLRRPPEPPDNESTPSFVCVGRLTVEKGQRLLIEAAARLKGRGRAHKITLVGDGPDRRPLEELARSLGVADVVEFAGWRASSEIASLLVGARALVLPSFAEGLPVVIMEALAAGRPVVSTSIAAIPELVESGVTGWLIPPGNVVALAAALEAALDAPPDERRRMGEAGRARVLERHHPDTQAAALHELMIRYTEQTDASEAGGSAT